MFSVWLCVQTLFGPRWCNLHLKSIFVSGDQHEHVARGHRPAHKRCPDIWRHGARHLSHTGRGQWVHFQVMEATSHVSVDQWKMDQGNCKLLSTVSIDLIIKSNIIGKRYNNNNYYLEINQIFPIYVFSSISTNIKHFILIRIRAVNKSSKGHWNYSIPSDPSDSMIAKIRYSKLQKIYF